MTGFDSDFDQMDRPFEDHDGPGLADLDIPEWKQPDMDNRMEYVEEELPYASTDFTTPTHVDEEDWW